MAPQASKKSVKKSASAAPVANPLAPWFGDIRDLLKQGSNIAGNNSAFEGVREFTDRVSKSVDALRKNADRKLAFAATKEQRDKAKAERIAKAKARKAERIAKLKEQLKALES